MAGTTSHISPHYYRTPNTQGDGYDGTDRDSQKEQEEGQTTIRQPNGAIMDDSQDNQSMFI